jgi:hypothetical protein
MRTCERLVSSGKFITTEPASLLARSYYELLESKQPILGEDILLSWSPHVVTLYLFFWCLWKDMHMTQYLLIIVLLWILWFSSYHHHHHYFTNQSQMHASLLLFSWPEEENKIKKYEIWGFYTGVNFWDVTWYSRDLNLQATCSPPVCFVQPPCGFL